MSFQLETMVKTFLAYITQNEVIFDKLLSAMFITDLIKENNFFTKEISFYSKVS